MRSRLRLRQFRAISRFFSSRRRRFAPGDSGGPEATLLAPPPGVRLETLPDRLAAGEGNGDVMLLALVWG